jgi:hypothetical protein
MSYEVNVLITLMDGAISISALLIAVITFLLKEYQDTISEDLAKPYKRLTELMMAVLSISVTTGLLSLLGIIFYEIIKVNGYFHIIYSFCLGLSIFTILFMLIGMMIIVREFLDVK